MARHGLGFDFKRDLVGRHGLRFDFKRDLVWQDMGSDSI